MEQLSSFVEQLPSFVEKTLGLTLHQIRASLTAHLAANPVAVRTTLYLLAVTAAWRIGGKLLHRRFVQKLTVMNELQAIGEPRSDGKRIKGTAVVCGGSIAGLWTARICADHFEDVLVVEPEEWVLTEEGRTPIYDEKGVYIEKSRVHPRSRVQQYTAIHIFQPLSLMGLNKLFPNFADELLKTDGRIRDLDVQVHINGTHVFRNPFDNDGKHAQSIFASRETIERLVRRLVAGYSPRIRWMVGTAVGVQTAPGDLTRLSSVNVRRPDRREEVVPAALVVDCSGPSQVGFKWLKRIYESSRSVLASPPRGAAQSFDELRIEYSSNQRTQCFHFFVPPEARNRLPIPGGYEGCTFMYAQIASFGQTCGFMVQRLEGHRIEIAFNNRGDGAIPEDKYAIKDFVRSLGAPEWLYEFLDILNEKDEDVDMVVQKIPPLSRISYEKAPYIPSNFVCVGDSVMRVNPAYGQGCTKAAVGAIALDGMLRSPALLNKTTIPTDFGRKFAAAHAGKISNTWDGTKPNDYLYESTTPCKGEALGDERTRGVLGTIFIRLAVKDDKIDHMLFLVRSFLAPQTILMQPSILAKVLLFLVCQKLGLA